MAPHPDTSYSARRRRRVGALFAALLAAGALPAAAGLAEVKARGKLIMLAWPHQESYFVRRMVEEYGKDGLDRFTGIDVEILRRYAASLGVELEVRPVKESFAELIPELLAGHGDIIGSSMTITEGRKQKVRFSRPYHQVKKLVLTRRGSPWKSVEDLVNRTAATVAGSSHEEHLRQLEIANLGFFYTLFTLENFQAVADGDADFTVVDSTSAERAWNAYPELAESLQAAFAFPLEDEYGFALPPGSDLDASLNAFLEALAASGELEQLKAPFLKPLP